MIPAETVLKKQKNNLNPPTRSSLKTPAVILPPTPCHLGRCEAQNLPPPEGYGSRHRIFCGAESRSGPPEVWLDTCVMVDSCGVHQGSVLGPLYLSRPHCVAWCGPWIADPALLLLDPPLLPLTDTLANQGIWEYLLVLSCDEHTFRTVSLNGLQIFRWCKKCSCAVFG